MEDFVGKVTTKIVGKVNDDAVTFYFDDGTGIEMYHEQDCCEQVWLEDISGDLDDLIDTPILVAECVESDGDDFFKADLSEHESVTWTFYKFRTAKGDVTLRWCGSSNGYYSEEVSMKMFSQ